MVTSLINRLASIDLENVRTTPSILTQVVVVLEACGADQKAVNKYLLHIELNIKNFEMKEIQLIDQVLSL